MLRARSVLAVVAAAVLPCPSALADEIATATVTAIAAREIYINLGAGRGVTSGAPLRLKRPVVLRHPVTRAQVSDWVPIGSARVSAVGKQLSMAVLDAELLALVRVGDRAEVYVERAEVLPQEPGPAADPGDRGPELDPDTRAVLTLWRKLTGQGLDPRIAAWERFLAERPDSPHAAAIREDIDQLRGLRESMRSPEDAIDSPVLGGLGHSAPTRADAGRDIPLAFLITSRSGLSSAWLHYRQKGQASYRRLLLRREGDSYLRGAVPAEAVAAPGLEYFVEVATTSGQIGTALGQPDRPVAVSVERESIASAFAAEPRKSQVMLRSTYLDFATFDDRSGSRVDRFVLLEAEIAYRVGGWVHAIKSGFGSAQGEGGFANRVYDGTDLPPRVGFHYGFAEAEIAPPWARFGLIGRGVAGVGQDGFGLGIEGRIRIGDPDRTHLSAGASTIAELGFLSDLRLQVGTFERAPLGFTVAVTDQPNQGDLGMMFAADLGWRVLDWFAPTVRLSYQARTVVHSGVGAGLGLVFGW